jgi:hypothetical protein
VTQQLNRTWLSGGVSSDRPDAPASVPRPTSSPRNRALRGSQRQLQDYVNRKPEVLTAAVLAALPPRLTELGASIRWVSPLAHADYQEYRDGDFLRAVGLADATSQLGEFWPSMGPCWDALGVVSDSASRLKPGTILVEAKSHINEIYGSGCQASSASLYKIDRALGETKLWLGGEDGADWRGPLYQYANRLGHLYFLLKKLARPAWLVNLYFLDDPIGPTNQERWRSEICSVKASLGLPSVLPNTVDVFLPALSEATTLETAPSHADRVAGPQQTKPLDSPIPRVYEAAAIPANTSFRSWAQEWMELASYPGPWLPNPETRIERLIGLWKEPVPGTWQWDLRDIPSRLLDGRRYTRGDEREPHDGEHKLEHEILCQHFDCVRCLQHGRLVDGVNAFPLIRDDGGGRNGNVEADLFLLVQGAEGFRLMLAEVKHSANHAWFAAVENLRQLKLLMSGGSASPWFRQRTPGLDLPMDLPVTGLVVAPRGFYLQPGQKANSVEAAQSLIRALRADCQVDLQLSVWDTQRRTITAYD